MPTYGYECLSCDNQFEIYQSIKDDALTTCETCGGTLRKRIYPVGISFKGSGFYVNDYAPAGSARSKPAEGDSAAPAAGETPATGGEKADAKADAKTEGAKPEPKAEASPAPKAESTPAAKAPVTSS